MGLAEHLSGEPEPCDAHERCLSFGAIESFDGPPRACRDCKFAKKFPGAFNRWEPAKKGEKHPDVVKAKREAAFQKEQQKSRARAGRNRAKIEVQRQARQAERKTERSIIHATLNSGRASRDGDHVLAGDITLDTKNQPGLINPTLFVAEVAKVRADAMRAGKSIGVLILRNKYGHGYAVMVEEDLARLVKGLKP